MIEKLREFGREHILSHLNLLNNSEVVVVGPKVSRRIKSLKVSQSEFIGAFNVSQFFATSAIQRIYKVKTLQLACIKLILF